MRTATHGHKGGKDITRQAYIWQGSIIIIAEEGGGDNGRKTVCGLCLSSKGGKDDPIKTQLEWEWIWLVTVGRGGRIVKEKW